MGKLRRRALQKSAGEESSKEQWIRESCRRVLGKCAVQTCCGRPLERSAVEKYWAERRTVLGVICERVLLG